MHVTDVVISAAGRLGLEFTRPRVLQYLWLAIPLCLITILAAGKIKGTNLVLAIAFRATAFILILLALAGLSRKGEITRPAAVIAAIDVSDSMGEDGRNWAEGRAHEILDAAGGQTAKGVVLFARGSEIKNAMPEKTDNVRFRPGIPTDATDLASAIRSAASAFPPSGARRLLIFSDGNENAGDAAAAAAAAAGERIRIDCYTPPDHTGAAPRLTKLDLPEEINVSEKFDVRMLAENMGPETRQATLTLRDGDKPVKEWAVTLQPGTNAFELPYSIVSPGTHRITASLSAEGSAGPTGMDSRVSSAILVMDRPKILCVSGTSEGKNFLTEVLSAKDIDLTAGGPEIIPRKMDDLRRYDCVILSNVPRRSLGADRMEMLKKYVRDEGGGLIMLGGAGSFGPGGYAGTPIEEILPIKMGKGIPFEKEKTTRLCIILLIDKSGSMDPSGFGSKIAAARRAAEELVKQLQPNDMVGIIPFDAFYHVLVPLGPAGDDRSSIINRIRLIHANGGTLISSPLAEALREMREVEGKVKHVILLTDGRTADMKGSHAFDYRGLIGRFANDGISVSTVGIGGDVDEDFLKAISLGTNGNYYHVKDAGTLPLIVLQDTRNALERSGFLENAILPKIGEKNRMLRGINQDQLPRLLGYVITTAKPRAETVLYTDARNMRDPILAGWRSGLGKTAAFTSDAEARWSKEMVSWKMFSKFWLQVLRWTMRERPADYYLVRERRNGERRAIDLQTFAPAGDDCSFRIVINAGPGATARAIRLRQVSPDTYAGEAVALPPGMDSVTVEKLEGGNVTARKDVALIRRISSTTNTAEYAAAGNNERLLAEIARRTGGKLNPPQEELTFEPEKIHTSHGLTAWLLPFIFVLILSDIALRKFG